MESENERIFKYRKWLYAAGLLWWILVSVDRFIAPKAFLAPDISPFFAYFNLVFFGLIFVCVFFSFASPKEIFRRLNAREVVWKFLLKVIVLLAYLPLIMSWGIIASIGYAVKMPIEGLVYICRSLNPTIHDGQFVPMKREFVNEVISGYRYIRLIDCSGEGCLYESGWYSFFVLGECLAIEKPSWDRFGHRLVLKKLPDAMVSHDKEVCLEIFAERVFGFKVKSFFADVWAKRKISCACSLESSERSTSDEINWGLFDNPLARKEGATDHGFEAHIDLPYLQIGNARFEFLSSLPDVQNYNQVPVRIPLNVAREQDRLNREIV